MQVYKIAEQFSGLSQIEFCNLRLSGFFLPLYVLSVLARETVNKNLSQPFDRLPLTYSEPPRMRHMCN